VTPILLDEQGVRDWMTKAMESGVDHTALAAESRLFSHLGLLPVGASLEQLELDLDAGQALGFYDADTKQLYILSTSGTGRGRAAVGLLARNSPMPCRTRTSGWTRLAIDAPNQSDRDLARNALPEGDATLTMCSGRRGTMSILGLLSSAFSGLGPQTDQFQQRRRQILREDLMFPYEAGLKLRRGVVTRGRLGPAVGQAVRQTAQARPRRSPPGVCTPPALAGCRDSQRGARHTGDWLEADLPGHDGRVCSCGSGSRASID